MFGDNTNIIATGSHHQILSIQKYVSECVAIAPGRAIFVPTVCAQDFAIGLSGAEDLWTLDLRYRHSGTFQGGIFARPHALPTVVSAMRLNAIADRAPSVRAALIRHQVIISILDLEQADHGELPNILMNEISTVSYTHHKMPTTPYV